jgi:hypothetical protein
MTNSFIDLFQTDRDAFRTVIDDEALLKMRAETGPWAFGMQTLESAIAAFLPGVKWKDRIEICLLNEPSLNATWFKMPHEKDAFVIGINAGLVETLHLIALDVFGYANENEGETLKFSRGDSKAASRVASRVGAFLEIGVPLGMAEEGISDKRSAFVKAIVEDAWQFLVLHELAHIFLGHDRGDVNLLRNRMLDLQIATFSIGQEHQADRLAGRLHSAMRRTSAQRFPGMEFAGPTLFFGVLGLFERYTRYQAAYDTPHAHPHAYERLYRLRVNLSAGDGHQFWAVPGDEGFKLARMELEANPEAVKFADAVATSLISVLEMVEENGIPSPINHVFNNYANGDLTDAKVSSFSNELFRWLLLGSPNRLISHLSEAYRASLQDNDRADNASDKQFHSNSIRLIDEFIVRARCIQDHSVQRALQTFGSYPNQ